MCGAVALITSFANCLVAGVTMCEIMEAAVELCSALGWDLNFPRLSSYVSRARPVGTGPYYRFPESREPDSRGRPAGLTLFRF